MFKPHFGWTAREFEGAKNAAVGLRANMFLKRRLGVPTLYEHEGMFRALLLVDVEACATWLGNNWPLNGPEYLQHLGAPVR
jgi:hypothetical protein